jgi:hypothetical protein
MPTCLCIITYLPTCDFEHFIHKILKENEKKLKQIMLQTYGLGCCVN